MAEFLIFEPKTKALQSQLDHHMQWTSLEIQNEILEITMDIMLDEVAKADQVNTTQYADISQIEVSICLRYVTECIIREIFIGFYPTEATERKCSL